MCACDEQGAPIWSGELTINNGDVTVLIPAIMNINILSWSMDKQ